MDSDLDKNCTLDLSPNTVLPSPRQCLNIEKRHPKGKPSRDEDVLRVKEGFIEIGFRRYRSVSCKNIQCRSVGAEGDAELKRGSIYQSSEEIRIMKKTGIVEGRRKIEFSRSSDTSNSFRIVDSLCNSEERTSVMLSGSNLKSASISRPYFESCSSDGFIEICPSSDNKYYEKREKQLVGTSGHAKKRNGSFGCEPVVRPSDDGNDLVEKDTVRNLHKSLSAKMEACHSPSSSESDRFSRASSKAILSPIRKMFDPFMKSKSLRSPLGYAAEADFVKTIGMENTRRYRTFRKSLLHDFSNSPRNSEPDTPFIKEDTIHTMVASSPVHLHGCLKLGVKQGVPFFEFSINQPEEIVLLARQWKQDNAFNWVYTFHPASNRKKSNACMRRLRDSSRDSSVFAQMQVSCCFCSEIKDGGVIENSMITEFVMYDIAHARQRVSFQGSPDVRKAPICSSPGLDVGCCESDDGSNAVRLKDHLNIASDNDEVKSLNGSTPLLPANLHTNHEIAAVVIRVPFKKRESLKYRRGDKIGDKRHLNLLNVSMIEECKRNIQDSRSQEKVKVVIPTGNHGFLSTETSGPSSLLDRWRNGGGCDCGGWDMACPLVVFGNPGINCSEDRPLVDSEQPLKLFLQGAKENTPALTMSATEGGYAVDFHAKLSVLQAFSICVAILHGTETPTAAAEAQTQHFSNCDSLQSLDDEVKFLIEAVTEEKKKKKVSKRAVAIPPPYVINPPFSPIARV
ncbi:putative mitochondrial carrier protein [Hibiscus syriacus]|uniref:Mitochondrial carrier protein n=2 Tax=Hibiscus syriacus TaxID=106335 RepID=A0A6A3CYI0_HIBSY|nr:putative mitochondrial carrier protein [Hibiscus syriacus]